MRRRYPVSDHCDGRVFRNRGPVPDRGPADVIRWWRSRVSTPWPASLPVAAHPLPDDVAPGQIAATFIGHSTFLIRTADQIVLTDPVFTSHAGPFGRFGPRRVRQPAHALADIHRVDLVLVSHNHYDHLQRQSLRDIEARFHPRFVTTLGNRRLLRQIGLKEVVELDWWEDTVAGPTTITCMPAQHFSARGPFDRNHTLWGGFALAGSSGKTIYFAGDTGWGPHVAEIAARLPRIDLAFLPIGAYDPRWFMAPVHVDPEEAVRMHLALRATVSVGMHFGTFKLTDEAIDEPVERLVRAREAAGLPPDAFRIPDFGSTILV